MLSGEIARRYGHAGLPDDTISITLRGHCRPAFRCLGRQGRDAGPDRRSQRLCRQGPVRRPPGGPPAPENAAIDAGERASLSATRCSTAPLPVSAISAALPGNASQCATPAPWRLSRAPVTTGCEYMTGGVVVVLGSDRPQLRGRHVRRHCLRARRRRHVRSACNMAMIDLEPIPAEEAAMERISGAGSSSGHGLGRCACRT